jgi:hypothetical protein
MVIITRLRTETAALVACHSVAFINEARFKTVINTLKKSHIQ